MGNTNRVVLERLFTSLNHHDHEAMASCYHIEATFTDIAFTLRGKKRIHAMWHMICETDIRVAFEVLEVNDNTGRVNLVDDYTFSATGRQVHNVIESRFCFRGGAIVEHHDLCDPREWAKMALGEGIEGFLAGRFRFLRALKARQMLRSFVADHPEVL